jgi:hypothetical protein
LAREPRVDANREQAESAFLSHQPEGERMSFEHLSANQPGLFAKPESASPSPAPRVKSTRSANRAVWWEQDLGRTATYLMGQARNDDERAFVERLYGEVMA